MYYVMTCLSPAKGYLASLDFDDSTDPDFLRSWMSGERFLIDPPSPLILTREREPNTVMAEMLQSPVTIMSRRLLSAITSSGASNLDVYPVEIVDKVIGCVVHDYVAFNLLGEISVQNLPDNAQTAALIARLAQSVNLIVVSEFLKTCIERSGIETLTFQNLNEYL